MNAGAALTVPNGSSLFIEAPTQAVPVASINTVKVPSNFIWQTNSVIDITGLSIAAAANSLYYITWSIFGQCSSIAGVNFGLYFSAAGAIGSWGAFGHSGSGSLTSSSGVLGASGTQNYGVTAGTDFCCIGYGASVKTGANPGNITIRVSLGSGSSVGIITIYAGSQMVVTKQT
jgi:hypothetical protein